VLWSVDTGSVYRALVYVDDVTFCDSRTHDYHVNPRLKVA